MPRRANCEEYGPGTYYEIFWGEPGVVPCAKKTMRLFSLFVLPDLIEQSRRNVIGLRVLEWWARPDLIINRFGRPASCGDPSIE